ncbi:uncharacterized protein BDW43DRAFT_281708 [Aspergillus alliaceus]|uniref:uncharacterized protein n=1 Tax=Petromyces alliaceus TaxID=209559 RepID=UPI0012A46BBA|nr:uncharacterized protein BDW43DRAFT_281708 [Aspergillus alliaceus]KAB8231814.1 hypothetical protein BDW43DRAFT_281708 [Aspergillus alliaceus]
MACGETNDFEWCFESSTEGKNCDITAQVATIQDAINKVLAGRRYWIYCQACFRLNHGETWRRSLSTGLKKT